MSSAVFRRLARDAERFANRLPFDAALSVVAADAGIADANIDSVRSAGRHAKRAAPDRPAVFREALYLTVTRFSKEQRALSRAIGISAQAVNQALIEVERRREDASYDRILDELELKLMEACA